MLVLMINVLLKVFPNLSDNNYTSKIVSLKGTESVQNMSLIKKTIMSFKVYHLGAENCVTGSCHLLSAKEFRILIDCGMVQGNDTEPVFFVGNVSKSVKLLCNIFVISCYGILTSLFFTIPT